MGPGWAHSEWMTWGFNIVGPQTPRQDVSVSECYILNQVAKMSLGTWSIISLVEEEPELVERYQLDIVGFISRSA